MKVENGRNDATKLKNIQGRGAIRMACEIDKRANDSPSTKGTMITIIDYG